MALAVAGAAWLPHHPTAARTAAAALRHSAAGPTHRLLAQLSDVCEPYARADADLVFPYPAFDPLHPVVRLLPGVARFEREHYRNAALLASLRTLAPPRRDGAAWTQLLALLAAQVRTAEAQITAAANSDPAAFIDTAITLHDLDVQLEAVLHRLGVPASSGCAAALGN